MDHFGNINKQMDNVVILGITNDNKFVLDTWGIDKKETESFSIYSTDEKFVMNKMKNIEMFTKKFKMGKFNIFSKS